MVDPKKAASILDKHFEELTTEQFMENLKKYCPEVFSDKDEDEEIKSSHTSTEEVSLSVSKVIP